MSEEDKARAPGERPRLGEEHTIAQALTSLDFWLMFASFLMGVGTGLAVMNNLGQMGVAMGYDDVSLFVSMTSIWGFFGRIASGTISEHFIRYVTLLPSLPIPCISSGTICAEVDMESRIMELEILRTEMRLDHDHRTGTGNRNSPRLCSSLDRPSVVVRSRWWIVGSAWKSQCRDSLRKNRHGQFFKKKINMVVLLLHTGVGSTFYD